MGAFLSCAIVKFNLVPKRSYLEWESPKVFYDNSSILYRHWKKKKKKKKKIKEKKKKKKINNNNIIK